MPPELPATQGKLVAWVEKTCRAGPVERYELRHEVVGRGESRVGSVDVQGQEARSPAELAAELLELAQEDAEGFSGPVQIYWCYCFRPGATRFDVRKPFRVYAERDGEERLDAAVGGSLLSTPEGITEAALEFAATFARIAVDASLALKRENTKDSQRMQARVEHLEDQRDEVSKAMSELARAHSEIQVNVLRAKREDRQHEWAFHQLNLVAPVVMAKLLPGVSGAAGQGPKDPDALEQFFLGLSTMQKRQLLRVFSAPEQVMVLQHLLESIEAGKPPAFADEILRRLSTMVSMDQIERANELLREDQRELFAKVILPYFAERDAELARSLSEERKQTNGAAGARKESAS